MPPVQNNSVVPKKQASKVWRYLGENLDGAIAKCLLCKYNPTKGDARKSSRGWWKHHESQSPLGLVAKLVKLVFPVPAASSKSEQRVFSVAGNVVTPKGAKLNPEKVKDFVVPVLKIEFVPPHAGFGSLWSPQKALKFRHMQPTT